MRTVADWHGTTIRLAESSSGVLVTSHAGANLVRGSTRPWPTPEILQKSTASLRFRGATEEDDKLARSELGYYCDLQSLNSEDAITWSVLGTACYLPARDRQAVASAILRKMGLRGATILPPCGSGDAFPIPRRRNRAAEPKSTSGY